jgi:hypothetical protein
MQYKFQNNVLLPKNTWSPFYNFSEHTIFSRISVIRTFTDLDKGSRLINSN